MADADHNTCSVEGCERALLQKGYCKGHYNRQWKHGTVFLPCPTCGGNMPLGAGIKYCSPECKPLCSYNGCARVAKSHGYCKKHLSRLEKTGSVELRKPTCVKCGKTFEGIVNKSKYCSESCKDFCPVAGCINYIQSRGYCKFHARRDRYFGDPLKTKGPQWSQDWLCLVCGSKVERMSGRRKFCGANCQRLWYKHKGKLTDTKTCNICGDEFDMWARSALGVKRRSDSKLCDSCKKVDARVWRRALPALIIRDREICQLCKEPVDVSLKWPHKESASVDHVIPRALGGSDDLENLQLAHLSCNCTKQDRVDFKIA